jgi:hypothetical protein
LETLNTPPKVFALKPSPFSTKGTETALAKSAKNSAKKTDRIEAS